jgi:hypothetical protein
MSVSFDPKFIHFSTSTTTSSLLTGLMSYWKLDETVAGANAVDAKGLTTLTNTSCTTNQAGKIGTSFQFNGASPSYLGHLATTYEIATTLSVSCWFKTSSTGVYKCLMGDANSGGDYGYELDITDTNVVEWMVRDNNQTPASAGYSDSTNVCDGNWHHVVGTFDGTYAKLYLDGSLKGTSSAWAHNISYVGGNAYFDIGMRGWDGIPYTGYIDEIGIWSRAITLTEVQTLYNSNSAKAYPFS